MCYFYRNIDDVGKTTDEINDNMENMRQIQDLLSTLMGATTYLDEVSLSFHTHKHVHDRVHTLTCAFFPELLCTPTWEIFNFSNVE